MRCAITAAARRLLAHPFPLACEADSGAGFQRSKQFDQAGPVICMAARCRRRLESPLRRRAVRSPTACAATMPRSSVKITPRKCSLLRNTFCSQKGEKPASCASIAGKIRCARHDAVQPCGNKFAERNQIRRLHLFVGALVGRSLPVRVTFDETMPRKVLPDSRHALGTQALHQRRGQRGHSDRITMKGTVTNHRGFAIVEVEHRRKTEVNTNVAQLAWPMVKPNSNARARAEGACVVHRSPVSASAGSR